MEVTFDNATLNGHKAVTKKEDLAVYSRITIKTTEDGAPELLKEFKNSRSLSNLTQVADNEGWKRLTLPLEDMIDVEFGEAKFSAKLTEIAVSRNMKKQKISYAFTLETETEESEINQIVIPYLNAREEKISENPDQMLKGPKYVPQKFTCTFKN